MRICTGPTLDRVHIELAGIEENGRLAIYNLQGKVVFTTAVKGGQVFCINKDIEAGVYLVQFESNSYSIVRKYSLHN